MPSLSEYEAQHIQNLAKLSGNIKALYFRYIEKIFQKTTGLKLAEGQTYNLDRYPAFKRQLDELLKQMSADMQGQIVNGIKQEWQLSNAKNDDWLKLVIKDRTLPDALKDRFFDKNIQAMNQFLIRKESGFTLSDRVWNRAQQFRQEVETQLFEGITEGRSAARMATDMKVNLSDPDKLFRRVRDKYDNLKLSKAAKAYHPGQGKYRSSYQNALRLSRTETNMAYRASDHERWKKTNFILGIEVKLSGNHPVIDICDDAKGKYPKEFKFIGWHPACRCYAVPIRPTEDQMGEYFDHIMEGKDPAEFKFSGRVENVPPGFANYIEKNKDRLAGYKSTPYYIRDNFKNGNISGGLRFIQSVEPVQKVITGLSLEEAKDVMSNYTVSQTTKEALTDYTGGKYAPVNSYLRGQRKDLSPENHNIIKELDSFIEKSPKVTANSYRGITLDAQSFQSYKNFKVGDIYNDKSYVSTSYSKSVSSEFMGSAQYQVEMTIKGKNGTLIQSLSDKKAECEILFGRDSKFIIESVKTTEKKGIYGKISMTLKEI